MIIIWMAGILQIKFSFPSILTVLLAVIIAWIILSLPVYVAAKLVARERVSYASAMGATLLGPIVYILTAFVTTFSLGIILGVLAVPIALLLGFIAWLAVFKSVFSIGWTGAFAVSILTMIIFIVIFGAIALVLTLLGFTLPRDITPLPMIAF